MAYSINRFSSPASGITVADGATNNTFDITLIGKGFTNYGEIIQENLVHILENFARNTAPSSPTPGQLWFNLGTGVLSVRTAGGTWKSLDDPVTGSITNDSIAAGAAIALSKLALGAAAQMVVADSSGTPTYRTITGDIAVTDTGVMTIAANSVGASELTTGTITGQFMAASVGFDNLTANNLTVSGIALTAGADFDVTGTITTSALVVNASVLASNVTVTGILTMNGGGDLNVNSSAQFSSGVGMERLNVSQLNVVNMSATSASIANLVVGNLTTTGTVEATYGDLAERYESDESVLANDEGAVVCFGGVKDITMANGFMDVKVAGVVSVYPAYDMNASFQNDHWPRIALAGQVPVRVFGKAQKGDLMVTGEMPGTAVSFREIKGDVDPRIGSVIGKAKEDKTDDGAALMMVVIGVR